VGRRGRVEDIEGGILIGWVAGGWYHLVIE